eukprot:XP_011671958.1 PREDICTED: fibroblast growth factor receptor-like [Strongylocentrotus purpuratus]
MWSTPIQVNGAINRYSIESYDVTTPGVRDDLQTVFQREDNTSMVYEAQIPGLSLNTQYIVKITPWSSIIISPDKSNLEDGQKAEVIFTTPSSLDLPQITASTDANSNTTTMIQTTMPVGVPSTTPGFDVLIMSVVSTIVIITVIVLLVLAIVCVRRRNRRMKTPYLPKPQPIPPTPPIVPREEVDPVFKDKEVRHDQVEVGEQLGSGQFGVVYSGRLLGRTDHWKDVPVAVKMVKDHVLDNMKLDLLNEIRLMIELGGHQHVLEVIACCTVKFPYYMVTEMLKYGDLLNFLEKCNEREHIEKDPIYDITDLQRYQIARQIASGMVFISSKRFYHGDLAARNILVGTDLMVKISDFGLSRDIYQVGYQRLSPERICPIRWASIETNTEGKCTIQSDIWSYGIILFEIFTNGEMPYKDMDQRQIIPRVRNGYRMEKPENCPDDVYKMMSLCWHEKPNSRPAFKNLYSFFDKKIASTSTSPYLDVENEAKLNESSSLLSATCDTFIMTLQDCMKLAKESFIPNINNMDISNTKIFRVKYYGVLYLCGSLNFHSLHQLFNFRFSDIQVPPDNSIPTQPFLDACTCIVGVFDALSPTAFAPVKMDVNGNIRKLRQKLSSDPEMFMKLQAMVQQEVRTKTTQVKNSATDALMWLRR